MTDCLDQTAPTDEEILCYALDGEPLSDEAREHVARCPLCQQRVALYTHTNTLLTTTLYRSQCPPPTALTNYVAPVALHLLTCEERTHIATHLRDCPLCSAELAAIKREIE